MRKILTRLVRKLKSAFSYPFVPQTNPSSENFPTTDREILSYCTIRTGIFLSVLDGLLQDHEPDEVETQMKLYEKNIHVRSALSARNFSDQKLYLDVLSDTERDDFFFKRLDMLKLHPEAQWLCYNPTTLLRLYLAEYGKPYNYEELLLKAEIEGKTWLVKILKSIK